jgi:hypothetical protein
MKALLTAMVCLLTIALLPTRAAAQATGGAGTSGSGGLAPGRSLDLNIWMGAGHHGRIIHVGQDVNGLDPSVDADNSHGQFGLGAAFSRRRQRLGINVDAESAFRADSAARRLWALDHRGAVRVAFSMTSRTLIEVSQAAKYTAVNPLVGTPVSPGSTEADNAIPLGLGHTFPIAQALTTSTATVVTHAMSRRSTLVFTQGFAYTDGDDGGALRAHSGGARFERGLNRHQTLRLGYRLTAAIYDPQNRRYLQSHDIDAGIEYKRGLPFSRGTTVRATTGTALVTDRDRRTFRVLADASLEHTLSRSWQARLDFSRPVQVVEGLTAPVVSSSVTMRVAGSLNRRHGVLATASYSDGSVSLDYSRLASVMSYSSAFRWQAALTRALSFNAEAFHGRSRFGPEVATLPGVPRDSEQLGVRVFVSLWRPLIHD